MQAGRSSAAGHSLRVWVLRSRSFREPVRRVPLHQRHDDGSRHAFRRHAEYWIRDKFEWPNCGHLHLHGAHGDSRVLLERRHARLAAAAAVVGPLIRSLSCSCWADSLRLEYVNRCISVIKDDGHRTKSGIQGYWLGGKEWQLAPTGPFALYAAMRARKRLNRTSTRTDRSGSVTVGSTDGCGRG